MSATLSCGESILESASRPLYREWLVSLQKARLMARLFAAIQLNDEARAFGARAIAALERTHVDGRFERLEKLHLTLAFFGSVAAESVADYSAALERAARTCSSFRVRLDHLGAFPDERRARLLWLGSSQPQRAYGQLMVRMREAFAGLWSQPHAEDVPHVTICRLRRPLPAMPRIGELGSVDLPVNELVLFESLPDAATTRYEARSVAVLKTEGT